MENKGETGMSQNYSVRQPKVKSKRRRGRSHKKANNRATSAKEMSPQQPAETHPTLSSDNDNKRASTSKHNILSELSPNLLRDSSNVHKFDRCNKKSSGHIQSSGDTLVSSVMDKSSDTVSSSTEVSNPPLMNSGIVLQNTVITAEEDNFSPMKSSSRGDGSPKKVNIEPSPPSDDLCPSISASTLESSSHADGTAQPKPESSSLVSGPHPVSSLDPAPLAGDNTSELCASERGALPSAKSVSLSSKPAQDQSDSLLPSTDRKLQLHQLKTSPADTHRDDIKDESAKYKHHKQRLAKMRTLRQLISDTSEKTAGAWEEIKAMKQTVQTAITQDDVRTAIRDKMRINVLKGTIKEAQSNQQKFYEVYKMLREEVISSQWHQNNPRAITSSSSRDVGRV
ncbi:uncharacterized protein [Littorina saxatilis]|uniref:uncharacterized protein n=1 Tax=Littorina saxatilis TaxID=31220 RepID=UPI0038B43462